MKPRVIKQGEYLTKIAFQEGFAVEDVWNHPKNKALRDLRKNPDVLCPCDLVWIPDVAPRVGLPLTLHGPNAFRATVPTVPVHFIVKDSDGKAVAGEAFHIEGPGLDPIDGTTGGDGAITTKVPVLIHDIRVSIPSRKLHFAVHLGGLDPVTETTGVQQRLKQLGYYDGDIDGIVHPGMKRGIVAFQREAGLPHTGKLDGPTRDALEKRFGS